MAMANSMAEENLCQCSIAIFHSSIFLFFSSSVYICPNKFTCLCIKFKNNTIANLCFKNS